AKGLCEMNVPQAIGWALSGAYLGALCAVLPFTWTGEKRIQELIEVPVRIAIGKYLKENSPPDATVGGEPLRFIGWYSERTYYDYPGLTSRRTADFLAQASRDHRQADQYAVL